MPSEKQHGRVNQNLDAEIRESIEALDRALRENPESDHRVLLVREDQYHALGSLTDETYDSRSGVIFKLLRQRILTEKANR